MSGRKSLYVSKNSVKNLRYYVFCCCCCIIMASFVVYTLWYLGSLYPIKTSHHIFSILFLYALLVALFYVPFWLYCYLFFICLFYMCVYIYICVFLLCSIKSIKSYLCLTLLHDIVLVALLWFIISGCIVIFCLFVRFYQNRKNISTLLLYVRSKAYSRSTPHPASRAQIQSCGTWTSVFGLLFEKAFNKKAFYLRKILLSLQLLLSL